MRTEANSWAVKSSFSQVCHALQSAFFFISERNFTHLFSFFFSSGQAGVVVGETIETYREFGIFCEKHGILSKVDKPTNFLWSDMDKGLDVEVPKHFKQIIHCFCQIHQERALSKEFRNAFSVTAFRSLCKAMSAEQVSDALDLIGSRSMKAREKIEKWGLENFVLHNIVKANPDTWTAGVRNSNLVEHVMSDMLGYGEDNGRGGMCITHFALTCHSCLRSPLLFGCVRQRAS